MLRTALFLAALVAAAGNASAHGSTYVRTDVVRVEPELSVAFGSLPYDGFSVQYTTGGRAYSTVRERSVRHVHSPRHDGWYDDRRHWRDDRRHWRDHRRHWRDDHRHWRHEDHRWQDKHRHDDRRGLGKRFDD